MAVAPEQSPTLLSRDDSAPPTPSDVTSEYDGLTAAEVLNKLEQAWCNELLAAELLDYKTYIVECVMEQVKEMEKNLSHIRSDSFVAGIHKLELERIKYVLCSYLRTRLNKVIELWLANVVPAYNRLRLMSFFYWKRKLVEG